MSPETTHKLMGLYMEISMLGVILQYMVSPSFKLFPTGCIGLSINPSLSLCVFMYLPFANLAHLQKVVWHKLSIDRLENASNQTLVER